jgi:hypothetical protein
MQNVGPQNDAITHWDSNVLFDDASRAGHSRDVLAVAKQTACK